MAFVDIFTHTTKLTFYRAEAELRGTNPKRLEKILFFANTKETGSECITLFGWMWRQGQESRSRNKFRVGTESGFLRNKQRPTAGTVSLCLGINFRVRGGSWV